MNNRYVEVQRQVNEVILPVAQSKQNACKYIFIKLLKSSYLLLVNNEGINRINTNEMLQKRICIRVTSNLLGYKCLQRC